MLKITVVGMGYVGIANALLLARHNAVIGLDIDARKIDLLRRRQSPVADADISEYLRHQSLNFHATLDRDQAYDEADLFIIATPTDYDPEHDFFDTRSVEKVARDILARNAQALIILNNHRLKSVG